MSFFVPIAAPGVYSYPRLFLFERSQNIVLNIKSGAINAIAIFYPAFSLMLADDTGRGMSSLLQ